MDDNANVPSNTQEISAGISEKDIARAMHQLAYRKAYNQSEKTVERRKERQKRIRLALEYIRKHPEVVREMSVRGEQR